MSARNADLVHRLFDEVFNQRDLVQCDALFSRRFTEHALAPFGTEAPGRVDGPHHMKRVVTWLVDQFPDLQMEIEAVATDGSHVVVRIRSTGTNLGSLNGVFPPTGKHFSAAQIHWYRVVGGRLAEHWAVRDDLTAFCQLGVVGRPG